MRPLIAALAATALVGLGPATTAFAAAEDTGPTADEAVTSAVRWLARRQQPDGGFDGFLAGAGTPDVVLALAESAQTEQAWGNRPALERVESEVSEDGNTPLDAVRRIARRVDDPQVTARLITRVALPVGLEAGEEGPLGDLTGSARDWLEDEDTPFGSRIELAIALVAAGAELPEGLVDEIVAAQQENGGWNAEGDAQADTVDLVTTGAAVDLLALVGADRTSGAIPAAMAFVGETRDRSGAWPDTHGDRSASATAGAIRAIQADGHDPAGSCWLSEVGVDADATAPVPALIALQHEDGSFDGDNPVRVTSDAVHALSGRWLPLGRAGDACAPESGGLPFAPSLIVLAAIGVVGVGGGVRIMRGGSAAS